MIEQLDSFNGRCFMTRILLLVGTVLSEVSLAFAQAAPAAVEEPSLSAALMQMMPMFAMVFMIFYFLVLRPQQAKLKTQQDFLKALKRGDQVVTSGGIRGRVAAIENDHILLEIAANVKVKVDIVHVQRLPEPKSQESSTTASPPSAVNS